MSLDQFRLNQPGRRVALVQEFYERHHKEHRDITQAKDDAKKVAFFNEFLAGFVKRRATEGASESLGADLGCRGGALTKQLCPQVRWHGVDLDRNAIELANQNGIPCCEMDITTAIDFKDRSFDVAVLTEVLEHLPYPTISVREARRILKPRGAFLGSVPLDYHLHRRWAVMRGGRLTGDPTHLHHFPSASWTACCAGISRTCRIILCAAARRAIPTGNCRRGILSATSPGSRGTRDEMPARQMTLLQPTRCLEHSAPERGRLVN